MVFLRTFFLPALLTVIIELLYSELLGHKSKNERILCICVNLLTNIGLNLTLYIFTYYGFVAPGYQNASYVLLVITLEIIVYFVEAFIYKKYYTSNKVGFISSLGNIASYLIGLLIYFMGGF